MKSAAGCSVFAVVLYSIALVGLWSDTAPDYAVAVFMIGGMIQSCTATILRALGK